MRPFSTKINVFLDSFKANGRENWPFFMQVYGLFSFLGIRNNRDK